MRKWRAENPERNHDNAVRWRDNNRDKERARYRRYDEANREKRRQAIARHRAENPEHHRALRRKWYHADPARFKDKFYAYHEQVKNPSPGTREYMGIIAHDPCAYCGGGTATHVDHIVPRSAGGTHDWTNLTAACSTCNPSKGAKPLLEWLAIR